MSVKAAIYTRISQDKKLKDKDDEDNDEYEREGVTRQLEDCVALAARLGWEVVAHYDDNDLSAFNGKRRPGFESLLEAMKSGHFSALLVWHPDRLYRSPKDLERLIEVADAREVKIATVRAGDMDLSTPAGRMVARILGSVARQESEHKGDRQRRANEQRAAEGKWYTANRCFGYTDDGVPLEPEATAFRQAVSDVLGGKSIRKIAMEWNDKGLHTALVGRTQKRNGTKYVVAGTWNSPSVRRLLVNPRYAALRTHRGVVVGPGEWEPLIDADTHRGLVAFLSDPSRIKCTSFERKYIGSGVYRCGKCEGGLMKAAQPGGRKNRAYVCRDHAHVLRAGEPVDAYVEALVLEYLARPDAKLPLDDGHDIDVAALQTQRAGLQARLDELADMFADGAIDGSQLKRGTTELRSRLAVLDSQLADLARTNPVTDLLGAGDRLAEKWAALSKDMQGKIVSELMVVTILPAPRGRRAFDPDYIQIDWKTGSAA
ncbi:recombinase family protein [Mycobacteroides chelonae]|uniref:recombinase family protein n=1 Tax=Mycobacteroides chelonae TaxID=1774 RepID=UPI0018B033F9|nr:recombinase family protein [Mycobacteroides chelonae]MBF9315843.1 recombinase family protein [Mycobacteroides chelonae]